MKKKVIDAARTGDVEQLARLLEDGADPNLTCHGRMPLHEAAKHNHVDCMRLLLKKGARTDLLDGYLGRSALTYAAADNCLAATDILLEEGGADVDIADQTNHTPLYWACYQGHVDIVRRLLRANADVHIASKDNDTPLHGALDWNSRDPDIVHMLLARGSDPNAVGFYDNTPLHHAADSGFAASVAPLAARGADMNAINKRGQTPLHRAIGTHAETKIDCIKELIKAGADVNHPSQAQRSPWNPWRNAIKTLRPACVEAIVPLADVDQNTVHDDMAECFGANSQITERHQVLAWLLSAGIIDLNHVDILGNTLLHRLCQASAPTTETLRLLIDAGADVHATNHAGDSPLLVYLRDGTSKPTMTFISLLLEADADPNVPNHQGETPAGVLQSQRYKHNQAQTLELLQEYGADPGLAEGAKTATTPSPALPSHA